MRVAGGQGRLKGDVVRLGHLGYCFESDIIALIAALEGTLLELGLIESVGSGVAAFLEELGKK
jgi:aspartate aminotransferase-like enzyme